jgi:hypothetical protein
MVNHIHVILRNRPDIVAGWSSFVLQLKLLDWTGRQIRRDHMKGRIPADLAPIMERVGLSGELWCDLVKRFGKFFNRVAVKPESLAREAILADVKRAGFLQQRFTSIFQNL